MGNPPFTRKSLLTTLGPVGEGGGGRGGTTLSPAGGRAPYNSLYVEAPPERGTILPGFRYIKGAKG